MQQHVALRDVTINRAHPALPQARMNQRVEIHDGDFRQQRGLFALDFLDERTGCPRKTEQADAFGFFVAGGDKHGLVEVMQTELVEPGRGLAQQQVIFKDRVGRADGQERECERRDANDIGRDVTAGRAEREQHEGKFAHLAEVDGGQQADAIAKTLGIQHWKNRHEPAADQEQAEKNRP